MSIAFETFRPQRLFTATQTDAALETRQVERILLAALGIQLALMVPGLFAYAIDERLLNGVSVWSKPLKFQSSLIVLAGTLLLILPLIRAEARAGRLARLAASAFALAATLEIAYITIQAARGRASHFNEGTPLEAMLYQLMGIGAVTIVISTYLFGWLVWRRGRDDTGRGLRAGAALGLMLGAVLTLVTAGILGSGAIDGPGHWVGGVKSDAGGLFLLGWSRTGGDLRVPHFFATHVMQALPVLGLAFDRFRPPLARGAVWTGAALSIAIVVATFLQAASGRPFI